MIELARALRDQADQILKDIEHLAEMIHRPVQTQDQL
jgi:hypothetical protein